MKLLVGLGNPGPRYAGTRHNIGAMAVETLARRLDSPPFRRKFQGQVTELRLGGERAVLLLPETFMNRSGQAVGEAARFHKIPPADVLVLHDDLDLAPGKVKVKQGGGHGGHNGLRDIDAHLGPDYWRVRLGIGHPGDKDRVTGYVLSDFAKADRAWLDPLLDALADSLPLVVAGRGADFSTQLARRLRPPPARDKHPAVTRTPGHHPAPEPGPGPGTTPGGGDPRPDPASHPAATGPAAATSPASPVSAAGGALAQALTRARAQQVAATPSSGAAAAPCPADPSG